MPLAGPDFERSDGSVKAEMLIDGQPLLRRCLEGRVWWRPGRAQSDDLVFVLRDTARSRRFAGESLAFMVSGRAGRDAFCNGRWSGAVGTGRGRTRRPCGCATVRRPRGYQYRSTFDPSRCFAERSNIGAVALVFASTNPAYSYLRTDADGNVVEAAEKRVISPHASAGTYFFNSAATYLEALAHNLRHREDVMHKGLFFVCPLSTE